MTTAGPNSPGTLANDTSWAGNAWSNPGNAAASDDARASATVDANDTNYLKATNFGFAIPADSTIDGVVVEVERSAAAVGDVAERRMLLVKGGSVVGSDKSIGTGFPSTDAYKTYGGASDLWGTTLTPADVNGSGFGCVFAAQQSVNGPGKTALVDHIRITVYYTRQPRLESFEEGTIARVLVARTGSARDAGVLRRVFSADAYAALLPFQTAASSRELQWALGGRVDTDRDLQWRMGGTVAANRTLHWRVAPSPLRVHYALTGRSGPVTYTFRFERRTIANQFLQDVTPAFLGGSIEANNDRDVFRTATFTVDANAVDDRGNAVTIDPLADHIAVYMDLLVDGSYTLGLPMGLFALNVPRKRYEPGSETWEIAASDNGIHLMEATTTASYTVAAAENYITGANAVRDILDDLGLAHALPTTSLTLPVARTWPAGTPWLRIVNDLLHAAGMYSLWFDASGIARTRAYDDLSTRTPDVTYTGDDFVLIPITEEAETTRLANQVVAVVDDPSRAVLTSVKTNADPDSPISTVSLGRTITKVLNADAADQTTLDAIAENYLRNEAGLYRRATLLTSIDPRRDAHEVYEMTVDGVYAAERWWARNWRVQLSIGAQHQHTLGKVERVVAS